MVAVVLCACGRIRFDATTDADIDVDDDGVADALDNCPAVANASQLNEDGDAFGDACDPCPPFVDDPLVDSDDDGLSDLCDPNPAATGDRLVVFEGFSVDPQGATTSGGTWTFGSGRATVTGMLDVSSVVVWPAPNAAAFRVTAHVTLDGFIGTANARGAGVTPEFDVVGAVGIKCVFGLDGSENQFIGIADNLMGLPAAEPTPIAVGTNHTIGMTKRGTMYTCGSTSSSALMATVAYVSPAPTVGIFSRSAAASFDWVLIVSSP